MKKLVALVAAVASLTVIASGDWTSYKNHKHIITSSPSPFARSTTFKNQPRVSINGVSMNATMTCTEGNTLRTVNTINICTKREYPLKNTRKPYHRRTNNFDRSKSKVCVEYTAMILSKPLSGMKTICTRDYGRIAKWERRNGHYDRDERNPAKCELTETVPYTVSTDYTVFVTKKVSKRSHKFDDKWDGQFLFSQVWNIPACFSGK